MKSLYEQEKILFARHADIENDRYISLEKARQLLGNDAVQYACNAVKGWRNMGMYYNVYGGMSVLTFKGFCYAFQYFDIIEIKKGLHSAFETPDYLARPEFA